MSKYKPETHEDSMNLSKEAFTARCLAWLDEFNGGKQIKRDDPAKCPVQIWIEHNRANCGKDLVANTAYCDVCGNPCCPDCGNHRVAQISRVTGYMSDVSGWNAGKAQEFKERQRFDIGGNM